MVPRLMMPGWIVEGQNKQHTVCECKRDEDKAAIDSEQEVFGPDPKQTRGKPT